MDAGKNRGSHRLRIGRYSEPGRIYIVTAVTHLRRPWFVDFEYGRLLIQALKHQHECGAVCSLAFVVMPDHLHWLVQLSVGADLSRAMQQVKGYSGRRIL